MPFMPLTPYDPNPNPQATNQMQMIRQQASGNRNNRELIQALMQLQGNSGGQAPARSPREVQAELYAKLAGNRSAERQANMEFGYPHQSALYNADTQYDIAQGGWNLAKETNTTQAALDRDRIRSVEGMFNRQQTAFENAKALENKMTAFGLKAGLKEKKGTLFQGQAQRTAARNVSLFQQRLGSAEDTANRIKMAWTGGANPDSFAQNMVQGNVLGGAWGSSLFGGEAPKIAREQFGVRLNNTINEIQQGRYNKETIGAIRTNMGLMRKQFSDEFQTSKVTADRQHFNTMMGAIDNAINHLDQMHPDVRELVYNTDPTAGPQQAVDQNQTRILNDLIQEIEAMLNP